MIPTLKVEKLGNISWKTSELMPPEHKEYHTGWKPGPVPNHNAPKFKGKKFGIAEKFDDLGKDYSL